MSHPRTLPQKLTKYTTDNFDVWLRKTNIVAREVGDLNNLNSVILTRLLNDRKTISNSSHTLDNSGNKELNKLTFVGTNSLQVDDEILIDNQLRSVKSIQENSGTVVVFVDAPFNPAISDNSTIINVTLVNLVSAINESFNESRRTLIKAIAMS